MCVYSMIAQDKIGVWEKKYWKDIPKIEDIDDFLYPKPTVQPSIEKLEEEIEELKRLLKLALEYDIKNNEPECESENKKRKLTEMAKKLGVEIELP